MVVGRRRLQNADPRSPGRYVRAAHRGRADRGLDDCQICRDGRSRRQARGDAARVRDRRFRSERAGLTMARIRSIKPEFWSSGQVLECSPIARLLFLGMLNFADDEGRLPFSAKSIKAQIFPADPFSFEDIEGMLGELSTNDLVLTYEVDGKQYLQITGWKKHQRIDKPQPAKYPPPPEHSSSVRRTLPPDRIGEDRKGKKDAAPNGAH